MFYILRLVAYIFLVTNFVLFLSKFNKGGKAYKIYTIYLGVIVLIEAASRIIVIYGYQNLVLSHLYFTGQFILLSLFFLELFNENYQKKIIMINMVLVPSILAINFLINPSQWHQFCLIEILLTSITIICYSAFHFYNMLSSTKNFYLINCGILIYLFGSTVTFLPRNMYYMYGKSFNNILNLLNIILYLVYLIFIFLEWRKLILLKTNEKD